MATPPRDGQIITPVMVRDVDDTVENGGGAGAPRRPGAEAMDMDIRCRRRRHRKVLAAARNPPGSAAGGGGTDEWCAEKRFAKLLRSIFAAVRVAAGEGERRP